MILLNIFFLSLILSVIDFNLSSMFMGVLMIFLYIKMYNYKLK